eukprot:1161082-Pelagomonas_calceolata.AAC.10
MPPCVHGANGMVFMPHKSRMPEKWHVYVLCRAQRQIYTHLEKGDAFLKLSQLNGGLGPKLLEFLPDVSIGEHTGGIHPSGRVQKERSVRANIH